MNAGRMLLKAARPAVQPRRMMNSDLELIKKLQAFFQANDGIPVYLKKGASDRFLYQGTVVLVSSSTLYCLYKLYQFAQK